MMEIIKVDRFWYEFWKPRVIVICKHNWEELKEEDLVGWGSIAGKAILYKCKECGKFKKIKMVKYDY